MAGWMAKPFAKVLEAVGDLGEAGIEHGEMTVEELALTLPARRQKAKALVNGGMSQRAASKATGIPRSTIQDDLAETRPDAAETRPTTRELLSQSDQNDWRTPRKYLEAARAVMGEIDLDPASSAEANETVEAKKFYTEKQNGLEQPWKGRVWLNPPYGGEARLFIERLLKEYQVGNVTAAITLVNSHPTETKWFQQLFDYTVCFVRGRIDFGGPSRAVASTSTHGSALIYLGKDVGKFRDAFKEFGAVLRRVEQ